MVLRLRSRFFPSAAAGGLIVGLGLAGAAQAQAAAGTGAVTVVADTPLPGTAIDVDKIPGEVQSVQVPALTEDRRIDVLPNLVATQMASVSLNDEQGSPFQPDFVFRGFEASPISGIAEGVAVYQDGVRLNESFGDNVNWDLIPEFAVQTFTVQSDNPVFGLNALGGAVTLDMKNGLNFQGVQAELEGGSFGNINGDAQVGGRFGDFAAYLGVGALHDDGFRYQSPTTLRQAYGDLAYQHDKLTLHLSVGVALNDISAVGPTPVQMLAADPRSVFTYPQSMDNEMETAQLRGVYAATSDVSVSADVYWRRFHQDLIDGNTTDVTPCVNAAAQLCLEGNNLYPDDALYDAQGNTVPTSALPAGATPGETDFTHTDTNSYGGAAQLSAARPIAGHGDNLALGASIDYGRTAYGAYGELGTLEPDLDVVGSGVIIDQGLSATASPPIEAPVSVIGTNTYVGVYGINVFDITPRLSWSLSGRFNTADIGLADQIGTTLNADHTFTRFNPGTGLTFKVSDALTVYGGYSEASRAPTPGELSCADPSAPCLMDAFLVADPALKQVVARTFEGGLRGAFAALKGTVGWGVSAYRTDSSDDILLLATQVNGFGYFANAGTTRRQGFDAHFSYHSALWTITASYAYFDATFLDPEVLSSSSPAADTNGVIHVRPGDQLPMSPNHRFTLSVDYQVLPAWSVGGDLGVQSGQYLVGDESNQEKPLPGYGVVNLHTDWKLTQRLELFGEAQNILNTRYYTYGAFTQLDGLPPNFNLTNPRTYSPAEGASFMVGARLKY